MRGRDRRLDRRRVHVERQRIDLREHRRRAREQDRVGRGDERERRGDDLVARPEPERVQAQVEAGRAARDGDGVLHPDALGPGALEAGHHRAQRELAGAQHLVHQLALTIADDRLRERDALPVDAQPAAAARLRATRRVPCSTLSSSASHEASMTFSLTPMAPHVSWPSLESMSTRVTAPVPLVSSRIRTLKLTSEISRELGHPVAERAAQRGVEGVDRAVALGRGHQALAVVEDLERRLGLDLTVGALLGDHAEALQREERP